MALVNTLFAWRTHLCIYLNYYMRINNFENNSGNFLHESPIFFWLENLLIWKYCFIRKELKIRNNQYFLFHLMGISTIQLEDLLYELMFPRVYSGTGLSEHRLDHWTWIWIRKRPICFFTHHFQNSWTSPPSSVLNFVKEFLSQLGVSKTLAIMSSFPHKLTHYHAEFQCFVTVMNSVLLQGVFIFLPHSKRCGKWGRGSGGRVGR